jgi:hypothetical protein
VKMFDVLVHLPPGIGLPDSEIFSGHKDLVRILLGPELKQFRDGIGLNLGKFSGMKVDVRFPTIFFPEHSFYSSPR